MRPFCVGLTGGIGCGKSRVAALFAALGAEVIDTDVIARELTGPAGQAMLAIREKFGSEYIASDGSLDRARMRARVFADDDARRRLEAILHPMIREAVSERVMKLAVRYVVIVVPLLLETGGYTDLVDSVLVVDCPPERQIERVMARDGISESQVRSIMAAQASRERRLAAADDVVDNSGNAVALEDQVARLHRKYLEASG